MADDFVCKIRWMPAFRDILIQNFCKGEELFKIWLKLGGGFNQFIEVVDLLEFPSF